MKVSPPQCPVPPKKKMKTPEPPVHWADLVVKLVCRAYICCRLVTGFIFCRLHGRLTVWATSCLCSWRDQAGSQGNPDLAASRTFLMSVRYYFYCDCIIFSLWAYFFGPPLSWRILGIRWFHFVTNASFTSQTSKEGLSGLAIRICWRRLSIFGHVRRLPEATPAHSALHLAVDARAGGKPDSRPEWKRQRGRPCRTWVQQIEDDTGLNANDAWRIAHDRKSWRALWPVAGQAFQWLTDFHATFFRVIKAIIDIFEC